MEHFIHYLTTGFVYYKLELVFAFFLFEKRKQQSPLGKSCPFIKINNKKIYRI